MANGCRCDEENGFEIFNRPLCLIDSDDEGRLVVQAKVLDQLRNLSGHLVVVAIVGPYRTGKSYLMNRLCGRSSGFPLGSTVQSKTKGIWVWVRVHPYQPEKYVVLLDTEGLGDVEKGDQNHDNAISCLATLLSSVLVYNIIGVIDNDCLEKLHFVSELSKHIQSHGKISYASIQRRWREELGSNDDEDGEDDDNDEDGEDNDDEEEDANNFTCSRSFHFPDFVFVLRDFGLELVIDGDSVSADQYLEKSLCVKPGSCRRVKNYNKLRSRLRQSFVRRKCFTFVRPVPGKTKQLETVRDEDLDPQFISDTGNFIDHILEKSRVKVVDGRPINGNVFASLVRLYVDQMSDGSLPCVEDAISIISKTENTKALESAVDLYNSELLNGLHLPISREELFRIHSDCLQMALKHFHSRAIFLNEDTTSQKSLTEQVGQILTVFTEHNEKEKINLCRDVLQQLYEPVQYSLEDGKYAARGGYQSYKEDIRLFEEEYSKILGSAAVKEVLLEFLHRHSAQALIIQQADAEVVRREQEAEAERQRQLAIDQQIEAAKREQQLQMEIMAQRERTNQQIVNSLVRIAEQEKEQMKRNHEQMLNDCLTKQKQLLDAKFVQEADQLNAQIRALQR